jgi:hypothetical protein
MLRTSSANTRAALEKIEFGFIVNSKVNGIMCGEKFLHSMLLRAFFLVDSEDTESAKPTIILWIKTISFCSVPHKAVEVGFSF